MADLNGRGPTGVESPGKAKREAEDKIEVKGGPDDARYWLGLARLEEEAGPPDRLVTLVNLQAAPYSRIITDWSKPAKTHGAIGRPTRTLAVGPFQAFQVRADEAIKILRGQTMQGRRIKVVLAPQKGDCRKGESFTMDGQVYETCAYADCPHHRDARPWSIWQAQHFLQTLKHASTIRDFINVVDRRLPVITFGHAAAERKQARHLDRMGLSASTAVKTY